MDDFGIYYSSDCRKSCARHDKSVRVDNVITRRQLARSPQPARFRWKMRKNGYGIWSYITVISPSNTAGHVAPYVAPNASMRRLRARSPVKRCQPPPTAMSFYDRPLKYASALGAKYWCLLLSEGPSQLPRHTARPRARNPRGRSAAAVHVGARLASVPWPAIKGQRHSPKEILM